MNTGMIIYRSWEFMEDPQRLAVFMWVESDKKEDSANWGWVLQLQLNQRHLLTFGRVFNLKNKS